MTADSFSKFDALIAHVDAHKIPTTFDLEKQRRENLEVPDFVDDAAVLQNLAHIVAYSQLTNADRVSALLRSRELERVFQNFDVDFVRQLNPCDVVDTHWGAISAIQKKTKVFQLVMAARAFHRLGSFADVLNDCQIPKKIVKVEDIAKFWSAFDKFLKKVKGHQVPFLGSTTSLLHLLMHLGYDCAKPDLIIMRVAKNMGLVTDVTNDKSLRHVVATMQTFAAEKGLRSSVVDLYVLTEGQQSDTKQFVKQPYRALYPG